MGNIGRRRREWSGSGCRSALSTVLHLCGWHGHAVCSGYEQLARTTVSARIYERYQWHYIIQHANPNLGLVTVGGAGPITGICLDPQRNIFIEESGVVEKWPPHPKSWVEVARVMPDIGDTVMGSPGADKSRRAG
jgi:hypothetical protein